MHESLQRIRPGHRTANPPQQLAILAKEDVTRSVDCGYQTDAGQLRVDVVANCQGLLVRLVASFLPILETVLSRGQSDDEDT